VWSRNLERGG